MSRQSRLIVGASSEHHRPARRDSTEIASAGVSTLVVVIAEVSHEVSLEGGVARHQSAGEGRPPTLLEDGPMDSLHSAIGLRSTGANEALLSADSSDGACKWLGAELAAVVGAHGLQLPVCCSQVVGDAADQS